jgi:hypothetical protein
MRRLVHVLKGRIGSVERWSYDQVVDSYSPGRLRRRYEIARDSLGLDGEAVYLDSRVSAFVKAEKINAYSKLTKPRVIMGRSPRYNLELASFLKPLEHAMYGALRGFGETSTRTRLIAKGLNQRERAVLIQRKMASIPSCEVMEVDAKAFEAHVAEWSLREEHQVYEAFYVGSNRLRKLLSWQRNNRGSFRSGLSFSVKGCRASGDFNTGLGNTLIMCCLALVSARLVARKLSVKSVAWDFLADGDNVVLFLPPSDRSTWERCLPEAFLSCGFEATLSPAVSEFEKVEFGQSRPVLGPGGFRLVRNPWKVLSGAFCSHRHYHDMVGGVNVLRSVAQCESVLNEGIPVLQEFAHAMLRRLGPGRFSSVHELDHYVYQRVVSTSGWQERHWVEVSLESRLSFAKAWGIPIEEQLDLEASFKVEQLPVWDSAHRDRIDGSVVNLWDWPDDPVTSEWIDWRST